MLDALGQTCRYTLSGSPRTESNYAEALGMHIVTRADISLSCPLSDIGGTVSSYVYG